MAKKTPKKFRQARAAAKKDAKKAFSGKKQAVRRDPTLKYSADDVKALKEVSKEARGNYITDDRGQRVSVKPDETARERIARERKEAMRKYRERIEAEDGPKKKVESSKKPAVKKAAIKPTKTFGEISKSVAKATAEGKAEAAKTKPQIKKAVAQAKATKGMTRAEKSAANKAAWKNMTPAERKNWKASKPGAKPSVYESARAAGKTPAEAAKAANPNLFKEKPAAKTAAKPVYNITTAQPEKASKGAKKAKFIQKKAVAKKPVSKPSTSKAVAVRPKNAVAVVGKEGGKKAAKAGILKTAGRVAGKVIGGRVGAALAIGSVVGAPIVKALSKDTKGRTTGDMMQARADAAQKAGGSKLTKDAYGRALPGGKKAAATAGATGGTSRSNQPRNTGRGRFVSGGGTTTGYRVETGDTLSGIAKRAGVTLSELMAANPQIKDPRKIYRNTRVKIPKSGSKPKPGYKGPVPYVPGSSAAKKYEASRKK